MVWLPKLEAEQKSSAHCQVTKLSKITEAMTGAASTETRVFILTALFNLPPQ
jgi:hypothetical protein